MPLTRSASTGIVTSIGRTLTAPLLIDTAAPAPSAMTAGPYPSSRSLARKRYSMKNNNVAEGAHTRSGKLNAGARVALKSPTSCGCLTTCGICPTCETRIQITRAQERARKMGPEEKDSTREQRLVQIMVFREITAYPDEAWSSLLGGLINRSTKQVRIFFDNTRQKLATKHRQFSPYNADVDHVQTSIPVTIPGTTRSRKMRQCALELRDAEGWTDDFFMAVVILCNIRARSFLCRQDEAMTSPRFDE